MRALSFAIIIAVLFLASTVLGGFLIEQGYGIPGKFSAIYKLEELGVLAGVGRDVKKPVVYEWPVVTLLKSGKTRIYIKIINFYGNCTNGKSPVTIKLYTRGVEYTSNSLVLSQILYRDNIFLILKIKIIINSTCAINPASVPVVSVNVESIG